MLNRALRRPLPIVFALVVALLSVMSVVPLGTAAQSDAAPTVGEIVVDSYDCDTGRLSLRVPITDLPHIPDSNGAVGYSVTGHYTQGPDSSLPGQSFNVEPENSPFTGDLTLGSQVPPTNDVFLPEESEEPIGSIESIDIFVGVGYDGSPGPRDTTSTTYAVDCGDATAPAPSANDDSEDTDTGDTTGAETGTNDGDIIPVCVQYFETAPAVQYLSQERIDEIEATWAAYDQSDIPPPQITGYPDPATGSCATENGVPIDYDPAVYTLICVPSGPEGDGQLVPQLAISHYLEGTEDVILADPDTGDCTQDDSSSPALGDGENGATGDPASEATAVEDAVATTTTTDVDEGEDSITAGTDSDASDPQNASSDDSDGADDITSLPETGAATMANDSADVFLVTLLVSIAAFLSLAALRIRLRM